MKTRVVKIDPRLPDQNIIKDAALVLEKGGLVAFPTETVYGIGANLLNKGSIDRLYKIKKRPKNKPFTVHIARFEALKDLNINLSEKAARLVHKFWPGPLTIIAFNKKKEKIGVRMPKNKIALDLIKTCSVPIVAPSANISGKKPSTTADAVVLEMQGLVDLVLDAGPTSMGVESTIVDVTKHSFRILRQGGLPKDDIVVDYHVLFVCTGNTCRSVMAKALLEKFLKQSKMSSKVKVDSAGTLSRCNAPAAGNTKAVLKEEGLDVSTHMGKSINLDLLKASDLIFVMEGSHRGVILNMMPAISEKVRFLKVNEDIPDPIGKSLEEYRRVKDIIRDHVENIFLEFFKKEKAK